MPSNKWLEWLAFCVSLAAYVPLLIGGWVQPSDMNVACFSIWVVLAYMATYSAKKENREGWKLQFSFLIGNVITIAVMFIRGGYTSNLTLREWLAIGGIIGTIAVWVIAGSATKKWNSDYLYFGSIIADVISFYPIFKQFGGPHETPSTWFIIAWMMFAAGAFINFTLVERLFTKFRVDSSTYLRIFGKEKSYAEILTTSAVSLENFVLTLITVIFMIS